MKAGYLSQYFSGVAIKRLTSVEANPYSSNQHEFNGVSDLKKIFGKANGKIRFDTKFLYFNDYDDEPVAADGYLTWYDAREKNPKRSEYRLYFPTTQVSVCAAEGDLLVIGLKPDNTVLLIIAENGSTIANQLIWLFGFNNITHPGFSIRGELESDQDKIAFASRTVLEHIGIQVNISEESYLDEMIHKFGDFFPSTKIFSQYARSTLKHIDPCESADDALIAWLEREEILFRTFERYQLAERLKKGFSNDVEGFLSFSLSVQNRRKSRIGYALENHLEEIFNSCGVYYSRTKITENKSKPDFIFPSVEKYHDNTFNPQLLTMLGVKNTCKDRWRQVLSEADKIEYKHLLTLETAISENQTNEMKDKKLQLVLPRSLHYTYNNSQQSWIIDFNTFINVVKEKQKNVYQIRH